jgi:Ca2+/Na+ antiporter
VVALTIFNSTTDIQLEATSIWRDIGMYIVATLSVITFALIGKLTTVSACIMLLEYVALVLIVYFQDRSKNKEEEQSD